MGSWLKAHLGAYKYTVCFFVNFFVHVLHFICIQQFTFYYVQGLPTKDEIINDDLNLLKYNTYKVN